MGSVTTIAQAVLAVLSTHSDIDYTSASDFLPAVQSQKVAALIVPFGQTSTAELDTVDGATMTLVHRLKVELWVKHTQGSAAVTAQRARDIATECMALLMVNDGDGYELDVSPFEEQVDPALVQYSQTSWLVSTLTVPVRNVIAVGD